MSVSGTNTVGIYASTGSQTDFIIPFYFIQPDDLLVQSISSNGIIDYNLNSDYIILGTPDLFGDYNNGALLRFNIAPASGLIILMQRITKRTQIVVLTDNGPFTADTLNHVFDKLTLITQESIIPGFKGLAFGPPNTTFGYTLGDWFKNAAPEPGTVFGWELVGSPTKWVSFGTISAE